MGEFKSAPQESQNASPGMTPLPQAGQALPARAMGGWAEAASGCAPVPGASAMPQLSQKAAPSTLSVPQDLQVAIALLPGRMACGGYWISLIRTVLEPPNL